MAKKSNRTIGIVLAITVAILLPLSFYMLAKVLKKDEFHLPPYYLPVGMNGQDTVYKQVPEIQLVDQNGDSVGLNKDLQGKIVLVNFFFTSCNSICPPLMRNMKLLQHAFRKNAKMNSDMDTVLQFVSISVDPNETTQSLFEYARNMRINTNNWWLCRGDKPRIYNYARNELKVIASADTSGAEKFMHTSKIVLLDRERNVRGYYEGLDSNDLRRCADDVGWLALEKKHNKSR